VDTDRENRGKRNDEDQPRLQPHIETLAGAKRAGGALDQCGSRSRDGPQGVRTGRGPSRERGRLTV
jgi:hypothetical protein